jgi:hypothetical protein
MFRAATMVRLIWNLRTPRTGWLDASGWAFERESLVPTNYKRTRRKRMARFCSIFRVGSREIEWFRYQSQTIVKLFGTTRLAPRHLIA